MSGEGEIVVISASESDSVVASKMPEIQQPFDHVGVDKECSEPRSILPPRGSTYTEPSVKQNCCEETITVSDTSNKAENHISDGGDNEKPSVDDSTVLRDDLQSKIMGENNCPSNCNSESVSSPVKKEAEVYVSDDGVEKSATDDFVEPDEELCNKIIKQIEFYFSDVNISKDAYLMKHARRNKLGFVSIGIVSSFKKVRALTKDRRVVVYSLRKSEELVVNEEGTKVRRRRPLPEYDETTPFKTVVAVNLGLKDPTVDAVTKMFSECEGMTLVRIIHPKHNLPADVRKYASGHREIGVSTCALIEFETPEQAHKACKTMTNTDDWRSGRHVSILCNKRPPWTKKETVEKVSSDDGGGGGEGKGKISKKKKGPIKHREGEGDQATAEKNASGTSSGSDGDDPRLGSRRPRHRKSGSPDPAAAHNQSSPGAVPKNQRHHHHNQGSNSSKDPSSTKNGYHHPRPKSWGKSKNNSKSRKDDIPQEEPSPWVQRRQREAMENSGSDGGGGGGGEGAVWRGGGASTGKLLNMVGVIRQPKGPDGTAGFCGGLGRGKPRSHTIA